MLKGRNWIPLQAKEHPSHEPRNGLLMCMHHHAYFDSYTFFIRFFPDVSLIHLCFGPSIHSRQIRKFIFINYSGKDALAPYHGKAIALDICDHYGPFPSLFIIHEMHVRGFNPFQPITPIIPVDKPWQDWILSDGMFDAVSRSFFCDNRATNNIDSSGQPQLPLQQPTTGVGGGSFDGHELALNGDVISDILAATHAMPSWRACEMEGISWNGTAENIQKYIFHLGVQDIL